MTIKHWLKLTFCGLMTMNLAVPAMALNRANPAAVDYLEPQQIDPDKDTVLLNALGMASDLSQLPIVNIMFLAQDRRAPMDRARLTTARDPDQPAAPALASRSDIILILSFNRATKQWTFFSFYRGMLTPAACSQQSGNYEEIITDYYSAVGRRYMIPCLEMMTKTALNHHPTLAAQYGAAPASFRIHGFIEATKEETLKPLAKSIKDVVMSNKTLMLLLYGGNLWAGLKMIINHDDIMKNLEGKLPDDKLKVDTNYLYVEAKERYIYPAGGYQRAFNFARLIADTFGWMGYGINSKPNLHTLFSPAFDKYFSRTFTLDSFMNGMTAEGKNAIALAAYRKGVSPVTIIQFGPSVNSYSQFQNGKFKHFGGAEILRQLKSDIQIMEAPASVE